MDFPDMDNKTSNVTDHCSDPLPYLNDYYHDIPTVELVFVVISAVLSVIICVMFFENVWFLNKYYLSRRTKILSIWQIGLYPVITLTSMLAVVVPRSSVINSLLSSVYSHWSTIGSSNVVACVVVYGQVTGMDPEEQLPRVEIHGRWACYQYISISLHVFMRLIIHYHGGEKNMVRTMAGDRLPLRSPPLACCFCCCPKIRLTRSNLRKIKYLVRQVVFLRPILKFLGAVLWTDGRYTKGKIDVNDSFIYITTLNVISSLIAVYGLVLLYRASKKHLKKFNIMPKYINLKIVMMVTSIQQLVFTILSHYNIPACIGYNTSMARGNAFHHMMLIGEMFLLTLSSRHYYRTREEPILLVDTESSYSNDTPDPIVQTVHEIPGISTISKEDVNPQTNVYSNEDQHNNDFTTQLAMLEE